MGKLETSLGVKIADKTNEKTVYRKKVGGLFISKTKS